MEAGSVELSVWKICACSLHAVSLLHPHESAICLLYDILLRLVQFKGLKKGNDFPLGYSPIFVLLSFFYFTSSTLPFILLFRIIAFFCVFKPHLQLC